MRSWPQLIEYARALDARLSHGPHDVTVSDLESDETIIAIAVGTGMSADERDCLLRSACTAALDQVRKLDV
jgi:hypothetical protein